jgi:hypothetical protein
MVNFALLLLRKEPRYNLIGGFLGSRTGMDVSVEINIQREEKEALNRG